MEVRKAVITAAGRGVRLFPVADPVQKAMLPIVDLDGLTKPVIQIIAEEALAAGIEDICVVCTPGDEEKYLSQFEALRANLLAVHKGADWARAEAERITKLLRALHFTVQQEPRGYGHAVCCARKFVGDAPFLLLLGDHLYVSHVPGVRCAQQLLQLAAREACSVAAVQATREHGIGRYGTLTGRRLPEPPGVYQIERIIEKPSVSQAELELLTPGLRAGHYLCFFGMHALTPQVFELLEAAQSKAAGADLPLTPTLQELARRTKYLALEVAGRRYDITTKFGLPRAQLALALAGQDRERVLTVITEALAEDGLSRGAAKG
jgi:UTP--glucose-1-phosphate uridylyltransferase